mgnify:FL=1
MTSHKLRLYCMLIEAEKLLPMVVTDVERSAVSGVIARLRAELPDWEASPEHSELRLDLAQRLRYIRACPATPSVLALVQELKEEWIRVEAVAEFIYSWMVAGHASSDALDGCFESVEVDIQKACAHIPEGPQALLDIQAAIDYDDAHVTENYRRLFDESSSEQISYS